MRTVRMIGLVALGIVTGVGASILSPRTAAQTPTVEELNARFVVGPYEYARNQASRITFRFVKDKQTGDCYLAQVPGDRALAEMIKTDDNACSGF